MMKMKHIKHEVVEIIDIHEMVKEEWFDKTMYRVVLINEAGEEISRIFSEDELKDIHKGKYVEHKAVDSKFA